ncbi:hypothetical protein FE257_007385, partial [Aspergillus nanangensis]
MFEKQNAMRKKQDVAEKRSRREKKQSDSNRRQNSDCYQTIYCDFSIVATSPCLAPSTSGRMPSAQGRHDEPGQSPSGTAFVEDPPGRAEHSHIPGSKMIRQRNAALVQAHRTPSKVDAWILGSSIASLASA